MKRVCPNCAEFIDRKLEVCPKCGKPVHSAKLKNNDKISYSTKGKKTYINAEDELKKKRRRRRRTFMTYGEITNLPDNSIHIETKDSIYYSSGEYSARKARGEYSPEKLKWWEIYKWADLTLTRRKVNKVVNRNSNIPPYNLSFVSMIILTILIGFTGLNHIYSKNYKRAIVMMSLFSLSLAIVTLAEYYPVFLKVIYSLGALPGLIVLVMWVFDVFAVIFRKYVYKRTKLEYIKKLDIETRAKLGKKYIDMSKFDAKGKDKKNEESNDDKLNEEEIKA